MKKNKMVENRGFCPGAAPKEIVDHFKELERKEMLKELDKSIREGERGNEND